MQTVTVPRRTALEVMNAGGIKTRAEADGTIAPAVQLLVSIVICTRNRAASLPGTLQALAAIRSRHAWEVVIADNASSDATREIILAADDCGGRLHYHHVGRIGLGAARDDSWRVTRGAIVAFTDDDCYPEPDYVDALVEAFERNPDAGCIGGRIMLFNPSHARVTIDERDQPMRHTSRRFVDAGILHGANLAFRRETLEAIGGFDPMLGAGTPFPCEDIDVVAAALWAGAAACFEPGPVVWHDHGRTDADLDRIFSGYDRGRGAYYAKYVLRRDTRRATLVGWFGVFRTRRGVRSLRRIGREYVAGLAYLRARQAYAAIAAALPLAALALLMVMAQIASTAARARMRRAINVAGWWLAPAEPGSAQRVRHLAPDRIGMPGVRLDHASPNARAVPAKAGRLDSLVEKA